MRILLYSISYSPEVTGSGRFNGEMTAWLAEQGHQVDVITAHPYYPQWRVWEGYRGRGWFAERKGNLTVYRTPLYVPEKVTGMTRILHELSFVAASLVHWSRCLFRRYDVVIGMCPPFHVGMLPYFYSRLRGVPFLFHVQDLQVDAARQLGLIRNERLLDLLDKVERFLLTHAHAVSSISEGMKRNIVSRKGVKEENYFMLENWVDINQMCPLPVEQSFKAELGFKPTDKIALYAGNIGEKQGLEILPEAARQLRDQPDIHIVVFGEGAARKRLEDISQREQLTNLHFFPIRPYEQMPQVLAMADIHLVVQKRAASDLVMPSKLVGILSAGGASIVSADPGTCLSDIIIDERLGWSILPEDPKVLADAIRTSLSAPDELAEFRRNARAYAVQHLGREVILSRLETFLQRLAR